MHEAAHCAHLCDHLPSPPAPCCAVLCCVLRLLQSNTVFLQTQFGLLPIHQQFLQENAAEWAQWQQKLVPGNNGGLVANDAAMVQEIYTKHNTWLREWVGCVPARMHV